MSYEQENKQALIAYFAKGAKGDKPLGALGVEVEHFVVTAEGERPVPYAGAEGAFGVRDVLAFLASFYPERTYGREGDLIGLASEEASITLEPAAQLEISIAPYSSITQILQVYQAFRARVDAFLSEHGCKLVTSGYHPTACALDLTLIPKQRYRFMNGYFGEIGTHGERMMRASASTQVSVDYRDEADAVRKMRVAQALAPILASMTDNTATFEGEPAPRLARFALWRDVDNDRCGSVPGLFDEGYGFADYADWILRTCPIFITRSAASDPQGPDLRAVYGQSAYQAYSDAPMEKSDVEHALSMFWPDVRLKNFVEIRPADSLPASLMAGYAALIKGIFYSEHSLSVVEEAFGAVGDVWPLDDASADAALAAIQEHGADTLISGKTLAEWQELLVATAEEALDEADAAHLLCLAEFARSKR